eukprot:TRINITY_DN1477_c0_g1_i1.p1 TRINITY_DN1477_c0_g1~~TRINITY_DN1477_c0_g1_i1.p1  ORF type:complete len:182 (-),score=19.96 TRINITY_DN1477_c0_g1_i1:281-826(-)
MWFSRKQWYQRRVRGLRKTSMQGHSYFLDNHSVKIFETFLAPGQILPMHSHVPHMRYCFTAAHNKHTWKDGTTTVIVDKEGDWEYRNELEHIVENVGKEHIHSLIFEFKSAFTVPHRMSTKELSSLLGNSKVIFDNRHVRAIEVQLAEQQTILLNGFINTVIYNIGPGIAKVIHDHNVCRQ